MDELTQHQQNLLAYFMERSNAFLDWIMATRTDDVVIIKSFLELGLGYLDHEIRSEMNLYERKSKRHSDLIDLLIEVHTVKNHPQFSVVLGEKMERPFRQLGN